MPPKKQPQKTKTKTLVMIHGWTTNERDTISDTFKIILSECRFTKEQIEANLLLFEIYITNCHYHPFIDPEHQSLKVPDVLMPNGLTILQQHLHTFVFNYVLKIGDDPLKAAGLCAETGYKRMRSDNYVKEFSDTRDLSKSLCEEVKLYLKYPEWYFMHGLSIGKTIVYQIENQQNPTTLSQGKSTFPNIKINCPTDRKLYKNGCLSNITSEQEECLNIKLQELCETFAGKTDDAGNGIPFSLGKLLSYGMLTNCLNDNTLIILACTSVDTTEAEFEDFIASQDDDDLRDLKPSSLSKLMTLDTNHSGPVVEGKFAASAVEVEDLQLLKKQRIGEGGSIKKRRKTKRRKTKRRKTKTRKLKRRQTKKRKY